MGCCTGDEKTYGCCAVPKDSCKGRAAQIVSITAHTTLTEFTAEEWDRLNETAHPFLSYAFLSALSLCFF